MAGGAGIVTIRRDRFGWNAPLALLLAAVTMLSACGSSGSEQGAGVGTGTIPKPVDTSTGTKANKPDVLGSATGTVSNGGETMDVKVELLALVSDANRNGDCAKGLLAPGSLVAVGRVTLTNTNKFELSMPAIFGPFDKEGDGLKYMEDYHRNYDSKECALPELAQWNSQLTGKPVNNPYLLVQPQKSVSSVTAIVVEPKRAKDVAGIVQGSARVPFPGSSTPPATSAVPPKTPAQSGGTLGQPSYSDMQDLLGSGTLIQTISKNNSGPSGFGCNDPLKDTTSTIEGKVYSGLSGSLASYQLLKVTGSADALYQLLSSQEVGCEWTLGSSNDSVRLTRIDADEVEREVTMRVDQGGKPAITIARIVGDQLLLVGVFGGPASEVDIVDRLRDVVR